MKKRAATTSRSATLSPLPISSGKRRPVKISGKAYGFGSSLKVSAVASDAATPSRKPSAPLATTPIVRLSLPSSPSGTPPSTMSGLQERASSQLDTLRKHIDVLYSEAVKEIDGSEARISKRYKIQKNACLQLIEEAEKDHKKISERINENFELIKSSYKEFATEAQASANRFFKVAMPELTQSLENSIQALRNRCGLQAASI